MKLADEIYHNSEDISDLVLSDVVAALHRRAKVSHELGASVRDITRSQRVLLEPLEQSIVSIRHSHPTSPPAGFPLLVKRGGFRFRHYRPNGSLVKEMSSASSVTPAM